MEPGIALVIPEGDSSGSKPVNPIIKREDLGKGILGVENGLEPTQF